MNFATEVSKETRTIFEKADALCSEALAKSSVYLNDHAVRNGLDVGSICYIVGGSIGRREALAASDFDLIPIFSDSELERFFSNDDENSKLRKGLENALGIPVSSGRSVMSAIFLGKMTDPARIGGANDNREDLTRRMLVLTEAAHAGGGLELDNVRKAILEAYTRRMGDRHPLAFCNDVVRYYRTLCIDYKAKSGAAETGWAESNVKLRHSRKLWYFATVVATSAIVGVDPESEQFGDALLTSFRLAPCERLFESAGTEARGAVRDVLESYSVYLDFMSDQKRRDYLNGVQHAERYASESPYREMQANSKRLHNGILDVLRRLPAEAAKRTTEWFFL